MDMRHFVSLLVWSDALLTGEKRRLRTFGAKLTIFPHPLLLSSALTGPPILVTSISLLLFKRTAALSSNLTNCPSGVLAGFFMGTITARRTSPRWTLTAVEEERAAAEMGHVRLTTQAISSPTPPKPWFTLCLSTLTHSMRSAPELLMTCGCGLVSSARTRVENLHSRSL